MTVMNAQPVGSTLRTIRLVSTPLAARLPIASSPNASRPTRPAIRTLPGALPSPESRAAATAWLAPLPPKWVS